MSTGFSFGAQSGAQSGNGTASGRDGPGAAFSFGSAQAPDAKSATEDGQSAGFSFGAAPKTPEKGAATAFTPGAFSPATPAVRAKENEAAAANAAGLGSTALVVPGPGTAEDWCASEALALQWTSSELGGFGAVGEGMSPEQEGLFPDKLAQLLDVFGERQSGAGAGGKEAQSKEPRQKEPREDLLRSASQRLGLTEATCGGILDRFVERMPQARAGKKAADARKREILKALADKPGKLGAVQKALESVHSLAELDAVENVAGLVSLSDAKFQTTLDADLRHAREVCREVFFGVTASEALVDRIESRFHVEQNAALNTVLLMMRCALDVGNETGSDAAWHAFASRFVAQHGTALEDKLLDLLARRLSAKDTATLLDLLFFLPASDERKLLLRMLSESRRFTSNVTWVAKLILLISSQSETCEEVGAAVRALDLAPVSLAWAIFTEDPNLFSASYGAGFEFLGRLSEHKRLAFVLEGVLSRAVECFQIHLRLEAEQDCRFMARLCAAAFRDRPSACDEFWRHPDCPLRLMLDCLDQVPDAQHEFGGALVAGPASARYALRHFGDDLRLHSLALLHGLAEHLDKRSLLEHFDIMSETRAAVRQHRHDPYLLRTLKHLARKFPQHVLTVVANESDRDSFVVLEAIKAAIVHDVSGAEPDQHSTGLVPGLELLQELLAQVEREQTSGELRTAFPSSSEGLTGLSREQLMDCLRVLGYTAGIDEATFSSLSSGGLVQFETFSSMLQTPTSGFFRVLRLSLQSRRSRAESFILQAVQLVHEVYRSHGGWRFNQREQSFRIGVLTTATLHACVAVPVELSSVRAKVIDEMMNDASTQETLVACALLDTPRASLLAQQLVAESMQLLVSIFQLDQFHQQKMALLCRDRFAVGVAAYIGTSRAMGNQANFPIQTLAVRAVQSFVTAVHSTREQSAGNVPSIVALLSKAPTLQEDLATLVERREVAALSLLTTALELEPGFAAMLLQHESILENVMGILEDQGAFQSDPEIFHAAIEFVGVLWQKRYSTTTQLLQLNHPSFWETLAFPLTQDVGLVDVRASAPDALKHIARQCFQLGIRAWALSTMTTELHTSAGASPAFDALLQTLKNGERDSAWLEQYTKVDFAAEQLKLLEDVAERAQVHLDRFLSTSYEPRTDPLASKAITPAPTAPAGGELARGAIPGAARYGQDYIFDSRLLEKMCPGNPALVRAVRHHNCLNSLADAQLVLMRAWKRYMVTRCLNLDSTAGSTPDPASPVPVGGAKQLRRDRTLSTLSSKHWGDMTSYTHVVELAKHLRDLDLDQFGNAHQQCYLVEMADMFTSMLHFKVFAMSQLTSRERDLRRALTKGLWDLPQGLGAELRFERRPLDGLGDRLVLSNDSNESPGVVQLMSWVSSCLSKLLEWPAPGPDPDASGEAAEVADVLVSLLTGLLMLLQVAGESAAGSKPDESATGSKPDEGLERERSKVLQLVSRTLKLHGRSDKVHDVCVTLLNLIFSQMNGQHHGALTPLIELGTFARLHDAWMRQAEQLSRLYTEQQALCLWLEKHGLSDLRVKVLSTSMAPDPEEARREESDKQHLLTLGTGKDESAAQRAEADRVRIQEISRQLGYKFFRAESRNKAARGYRDFVSKGTSNANSEDGLAVVSVIHLLFDYGVTSVAGVISLDQEAMQSMGIYKQSDRRRLLDIIKLEADTGPGAAQQDQSQAARSGATQDAAGHKAAPQTLAPEPAKKKQRRHYFSRALGHRKRDTLQQGALRLQNILRVFMLAVSVDGGEVGPRLAALNIVQSLAEAPLLRAVAGDKPFTRSMDNRASAVTIRFRAYTVRGGRDPVHQLWCLAMRFVAQLLRSNRSPKENRHVEHALDFVDAHRGAILSALTSFRHHDSVLTLGGLDEVCEATGLLREMANHTQRWRLRGRLYWPLLNATWALVDDLVTGPGKASHGVMEEFGRFLTSFKASKTIPRLCSMSRRVSLVEDDLDTERVSRPSEEAQRGSSMMTPRGPGPLARTPSIIGELADDSEHGSFDALAIKQRSASASSASSSTLTSPPQDQDDDISVLHVAIEYRICRILQQVLALLRNRNVVKVPWQLETDEQQGQRLPARYWAEAVIPFPLPRTVPDEPDAGAARSSASGGAGSTAGRGALGGPGTDTLMSLLNYCRCRLSLCKGPASSHERGSQASQVSQSSSLRWQHMMRYLVTNTLHVLAVSLELTVHERQRADARVDADAGGVRGGGGNTPHNKPQVNASVVRDMRRKLTPDFDRFKGKFEKLGLYEAKLFDNLRERIDIALEVLSHGAEEDMRLAELQAAKRAIVNTPQKPKRMVRALPSSHGPEVTEVGCEGCPPQGVIIWLHGAGGAKEVPTWEAVFRDFGLRHVRILLPHLDALDQAPASGGAGATGMLRGEDAQGVVRWYCNGRPMPACQAGAFQARPESNLDAVLRLPDPQSVVQNLLGRAERGAAGRAPADLKALTELYAMISAKQEDRDALLRAAEQVRKLVREQMDEVKPSRIILGGFQEGGSLALLTTLMCGMEADPIILGGTFCINAHLPLANEFAPSLVQLLGAAKKGENPVKQRFPGRVVLRNGQRDNLVDPTWAEMTARTLHVSGLEVDFSLSPGLAHSAWDLDQLRALWELANAVVPEEAPGAPAALTAGYL